MNIEVIRYRLPVYWACALINDDYTGLCKEECQEIKNFLNIADGYPVDVDWETDKKVMLCVFDYGLSTDNVIYYNHTNTLSFNWCDYREKITQEEFDDFVNNVDRSQLPEGIKFELK